MTTDYEANLERRLAALTETTERLSARVDALEKALQQQAPPTSSAETPVLAEVPTTADPQTTAERAAAPRGPGLAGLIGRTFIVLGGAFFLRAFTDGGYLSNAAGVALGLGYATVWIVMADRMGQKGHKRSAAFHHLTASLIGYPLIWEASASFDVLSPWPSAAVLATYASIELFVAGRRACRIAAWVTSFAATVSGLGLLVTQHAFLPFVGCIFVVAVGLFWVGERNGWRGIIWPAAMTANLIAGLMTLLVVAGEVSHWFSATEVQIALLGVIGLCAVRFIRGHFLKRKAGFFDVTQTMAAIFIGYGGLSAIATTSATGWVFGVVGLGAAVPCYVLSMLSTSNDTETTVNYHLGLWMGATFLVLGALVALPASTAGVLFVAAALIAAWLGQRPATRTLRLQTVFFALVAFVVSGLASDALNSFLGSASRPLAQLEPSAWAAFIICGATFAVLRIRRPDEMPKSIGTWVETAVMLLTLFGAFAVILANLAGPIAQVGAGSADAGALAVLRTAVLAATAAGLAFLSTRPGWVHVRRVVLPLLVVMGIKFVLEDLRKGSTETLVLSFVLFGLAMIVAAKTDPRDKADPEHTEAEH